MDRVETFNEYRPLLFSIAYRMLGTVMDAEDMVQEAFIRWQGISSSELRSAKAYLTTIVTRLCIDHLRSARVQREAYVGEWLPEPLLTDEAGARQDAAVLAESLSTAFLVLLESLSPVERAVFLLREIFAYDYAEIAAIVDKSEANCRQMMSRARRHISERRPRFDASHEQQQRLARQFLQACTQGDVDGLLAILADDITLYSDSGGVVPAARKPVYGADKVMRLVFGLMRKAPPNLEVRLSQVNGQPGILVYADGQPLTVWTLDIRGGRIRNIYSVVNPAKLRQLPPLAALDSPGLPSGPGS